MGDKGQGRVGVSGFGTKVDCMFSCDGSGGLGDAPNIYKMTMNGITTTTNMSILVEAVCSEVLVCVLLRFAAWFAVWTQ